MGPKHNSVHFKTLLGCLLIKSWSSFQHLIAGKNMKGNPISTFSPCFSFHIGKVIQIWQARLMGSLRNISLTVVTVVTVVSKRLFLHKFFSTKILFCTKKSQKNFFDKKKLELWWTSKTQIVMRLKNWNFGETHKLKLWWNSKTQILMILKN